MTDVFRGLNVEFAEKARKVLVVCEAKYGVRMHPYSGLRSPLEQANVYMQGRREADRQAAIGMFMDKGATYLADVMRRANIKAGKRVTNALPGLSWHNFGEALDCGWLKNGKSIEWNDLSGYAIYANVAREHGLTAGASFNDHPHIQLRKESSPRKSPDFTVVKTEKGSTIIDPIKGISEALFKQFG